MGFQNFSMHFLDEPLSQNVVHIDNLPFLGNIQNVLGVLSSCVVHGPSYLTKTIPLSSSFLSFLASFNERGMEVCGDIMGLGLWESFQGPLARLDILWWYRPSLYGRLCPIYFFKELSFSGFVFVL
jgi:hypothetical protein